jgi:hypothetical protein
MGKQRKPMTRIKNILQSVKYANGNIDRLNDLIAVIRSRAEKVTTGFSDAPGGGGTSDRADVIAKLIETERKQEEAVRSWCDAIEKVQALINSLTDYNERAVLEHRYINCQDWMTISYLLNFSLQHLYRIHGRALYKLSQKLRGNESF